MFEGSSVALVTPFKNGKVDEKKLRDLVEFQIEGGTACLVPCGTTGESATLTHKEHARVVELVVKAARGRIRVMAGSGSNSTHETIELTKHAKSVGADGALLIAPYYNKPTQRGLTAHFQAVARAVKPFPLVLYNIPSRTGINVLPQTIVALARAEKNIVGVKEASGSLDQSTEIARALGPDFEILSGDDSLTLPIMSVGGKGVVSVLANIAPREVQNLCAAALRGDMSEARTIHQKMFPLIKTLFIETNPIPIKAAMAMMRLCAEDLRLPLVKAEESTRAKLKAALKDYGLL